MIARMKVKIGDRFGRLLVAAGPFWHFTHLGRKIAQWDCACECGRTSRVLQWNLTNGNSTSCGCWRKERNALPQGTPGGRRNAFE